MNRDEDTFSLRHGLPIEASSNSDLVKTYSVYKLKRNVWRVEKARRLAVLIDGQEFFRAFVEAALNVEMQILIVGWDTDSRTSLKLNRDQQQQLNWRKEEIPLSTFLQRLIDRRPQLQVYVLCWDYSWIYLLERELFQNAKFKRSTERCVQFVHDRHHVALASHHQKIIVMDHRVAFSGGLDLTQRRWDTRSHFGFDQRRRDPKGLHYGPFHDVQIVVEGQVAEALGQIARERWHLATGLVLPGLDPRLEKMGEAPWPASALFRLENVEVAISRTLPFGYRKLKSGEPSRPVLEIEHLYLDMIRRARRYIYIENQYFTSPVIARAIEKKLIEADGPEVVLVLPCRQTGWLEKNTMGVLRNQAIQRILKSDRFHRFRLYYPYVPNLGLGYVKVHAKVMIVDDEFFHVGSANLNSRSMGLDTECDLSVEAGHRLEIKRFTRRFLCELLSEHLGIELSRLIRVYDESLSLIQAIEHFRQSDGDVRGLRDLSLKQELQSRSGLSIPRDWIDPNHPYGIRRWAKKKARRWLLPEDWRMWSLRLLLILSSMFFIVKDAKADDHGELAQMGPASEEKWQFHQRALMSWPIIIPGFQNSQRARDYFEFCPYLRVKLDAGIQLTPMETRLLCGDNSDDQFGRPWRTISANQAAYFMTGFLQARGFHSPEYIQDGQTLFVDSGPLSRLHFYRFQILDPTPSQKADDFPARRHVLGFPMTPNLLDEMEGWVGGVMKERGFACVEAKAVADPKSEFLLVQIRPDSIRTIADLQTHGDLDFDEEVLNRYNAFRIGDEYQESLVALSRNRTKEDGFLQSIDYRTECLKNKQVRLIRSVSQGPSRLIRLGFGASSEIGARARLILRQSRIGSNASSTQFKINTSYLNKVINQQILESQFRWYYARGEPRSYFSPQLIYEKIAEEAYAVQSVEVLLHHAWGREFKRGSVELLVGPTILKSTPLRGKTLEDSTSTLAELNLKWLSHDFEFFGASPRNGEYITAHFLMAHEELASPFSAQRFQVRGQKLWSFFNMDPPLFIFGCRFDFSSVFSQSEIEPRVLPLRFLTFAGGESDLRGFARESLPASGTGALSALLSSIEGRFHKVLFKKLDIFTFLDFGKFGGLRFQMQSPVFLSPGVGIRWESRFGSLRTYLAQRQVLNGDESTQVGQGTWRGGFTFGEEF